MICLHSKVAANQIGPKDVHRHLYREALHLDRGVSFLTWKELLAKNKQSDGLRLGRCAGLGLPRLHAQRRISLQHEQSGIIRTAQYWSKNTIVVSTC